MSWICGGFIISKLGSLEFFENLSNMIAYREGFGDILAEGLLRAGQRLGEEARAHFSNEVSADGFLEYAGPRW